jgi:hypothetical protein
MKKTASIVILSLLVISMKAQSVPAQDGKWKPLILNSSGSNTLNGVEANYALGNDVVIIQLVNHTTDPVKVVWKDIVITKNGQSYSENTEELSTIAPKVRAADDVPNTIQVQIKLSDFNTTAGDFKTLTVSDFNVISNN